MPLARLTTPEWYTAISTNGPLARATARYSRAMPQVRYAIAIALTLAACSSNRSEPPAPTALPAPRAAAAPPAVTAADDGDGAAFVAAPRRALVGHRAPPVRFEMLDGTPVDLGQLLGRQPIYLKFWATWCVPCREQMPHAVATWRAHKDRLAVFALDIGVNDPIENVRAFVAEQKLQLPVAIDRDGSAAELLHLNVTPQHVVIDRSGVIRHVGHAVTPALERAIADVVADTAPAPVTAEALPAPGAEPPALALDDGTTLELATRPRGRLALTFVKLSCDTYIVKSQPAMGAACAEHARRIEEQRRAHPELAWVVVAHPVWTQESSIAGYRKRLGVSAPIGIDHSNAWFRRFRVRDVYTTVLLDGAGAELGRAAGDGATLAALVSVPAGGGR
jgi:peroxiredoxin